MALKSRNVEVTFTDPSYVSEADLKKRIENDAEKAKSWRRIEANLYFTEQWEDEVEGKQFAQGTKKFIEDQVAAMMPTFMEQSLDHEKFWEESNLACPTSVA